MYFFLKKSLYENEVIIHMIIVTTVSDRIKTLLMNSNFIHLLISDYLIKTKESFVRKNCTLMHIKSLCWARFNTDAWENVIKYLSIPNVNGILQLIPN